MYNLYKNNMNNSYVIVDANFSQKLVNGFIQMGCPLTFIQRLTNEEIEAFKVASMGFSQN